MIFKQRYGARYKESYLKYINKDYSDSLANVNEQNKLLKEFVKFSVEHSAFYRDFYKNVDVENFNGLSDLHLLPILTKEMLRTNISSIRTIKKNDGVSSFTGGTTGKSLEVVFTLDDFQERMAYLDAFKFKVGVEPMKAKKATFSGREIIKNVTNNIFWRDNKAYNQRLYSTFHLKPEYIKYYVSDMNDYQPEVINGFVSAIYEVSKWILEHNIVLTFTPSAIFTTSETLLPHHRATIERAFKCKIYNQYASAEGAPFVTQCVMGELHYNLDTGVIETLADTNSVLVTSFTSHGTPLIRYDIGDQIIFKDGVCKCGSAHPLVSEISGRAVDFLYGLNGEKVSLSHLADVIKGLPNCVRNIQFIQPSKKDINVLIEVDENIYERSHEQKMLDALRFRFGSSTNITISVVDNIEREKSGKFRLIKREY